jgi:hypothetical protein
MGTSTMVATIGSQSEIIEKIVGTWELTGFEGDGVWATRLGEQPSGVLNYDSSGRMSVQIMNLGRAGLQLDSEKDYKDALISYMAYFGTYVLDLDQGSVTHEIMGSLHPEDIGRQFKRLYEFKDDELILTTLGSVGGERFVARLIWRRFA